MKAPDQHIYAHPAWLILILSLAPTIGLGIGRFAYALVLPDMRDALGWSYSAAGFMNTINAVGYLAGALLLASRMISALRAVANGPLGNACRCRLAGAMCRLRQFFRAELCAIAGGRRRGGRVRRRRGAGRHDRANAPRARQLPAQPVLCRAGARHYLIGADRAVRAAGLWARIVVDRVVDHDAALRRPGPAAVAGAARQRGRDRAARRPPNSPSGRC